MLKNTAGVWQEWALVLNSKNQRRVAEDYSLSASEQSELALASKRFKKRQYQSRFRQRSKMPKVDDPEYKKRSWQRSKMPKVDDPEYKKRSLSLCIPAPGETWPTWLLSIPKKGIPDMIQHLTLTSEQRTRLYDAAASYKSIKRRDNFF